MVLDCLTRWNSTCTMLTTALKFRLVFDRMENEGKLYYAYFCEEEGEKKKLVMIEIMLVGWSGF